MIHQSISEFNYSLRVKVRFQEVDMLNVCNNVTYITYFEESRLGYLANLGLIPENGVFSDGLLNFIVRNEINYFAHAKYADELNIYARISYLKYSSFGFEHLVENNKTKEIIADGKGVIVFVDPKTEKSTKMPDEFRRKVLNFEKNVRIFERE